MKLLLFISHISSSNQYDWSLEAKGICDEIMNDTHSHMLYSAETNFLGKYLQKVRPKESNKKQFQLINWDTVTPHEVFEEFIGFDDELLTN